MKARYSRNRQVFLIVAAAAVAVSGWVAFAITVMHDPTSGQNVTEVREGGWALISPLLECTASSPLGGERRKLLEQSLESVVRSRITAGSATHISLYFRDLNNGPWIGINEDEKFAPGSMLKVPVMMAYYHAAEKDPTILQKEIEFQPYTPPDGSLVSQEVDSSGQLVRGRKYTVESLIANMIIYSDNNATALLWDFIDQEKKDRAYRDLGLTVPVITDWMSNVISVRDYATFMRVLYNASYLGREYSSHALDLLTKTSFRDGLVAGLPVGTKVAHKFGIRFKEGTTAMQLHDCGIVYAPDRPFLLCVMTKGHSLQQQGETIAEITRVVYDSVAGERRR